MGIQAYMRSDKIPKMTADGIVSLISIFQAMLARETMERVLVGKRTTGTG
jgi:hypothetical protein